MTKTQYIVIVNKVCTRSRRFSPSSVSSTRMRWFSVSRMFFCDTMSMFSFTAFSALTKGVDYAIPAYYVIASAEASSNLSRFDGVKYGYRTPDFEDLQDVYKKTRDEGFGMEVKRRMMIGAFVLSSGYYDAYYIKALQVKALIKKGFDEAFAKYDIILGPTIPDGHPDPEA